MGQKVNPISLRLQYTNRSFDSHWFSLYYYKDLLSRDLAVGHYLTDIANHIKESQARVSYLSLPKRSKILLAFFNPKKLRDARSQNSPLSRTSSKSRQSISKVLLPVLLKGNKKDNLLPLLKTKTTKFFSSKEDSKQTEKEGIQPSYLSSQFDPVRNQIVDITTARLNKRREPINLSSFFPCYHSEEERFDFLGLRMRKLLVYWYQSSFFQQKKEEDLSPKSLIYLNKVPNRGPKEDIVQLTKGYDLSQVTDTKGSSYDKDRSSYFKDSPSVTTLRTLITSLAKNPRLLYKESVLKDINTQENEDRIISKKVSTLETTQNKDHVQYNKSIQKPAPLNIPLFNFFKKLYQQENFQSVFKREVSKNNILRGLQLVSSKRSHKNLSFLQRNLSRIHLHPVWLEGLRIPNQNQSPSLLAQEIVYYLERRTPLYQIKGFLFKSLEKMRFVKGVRISLSGRLGGRTKKAQRGQTETFQYGETKFHVFSSKIDYYSTSALTPFGRVGVKVWLSFADN